MICYCSREHSAFASLKMGISRSASLHALIYA